MKTKYGLKDICIVPSIISNIEHRSEINIPKTLPLITAPMSSVCSEYNIDIYEKNGIHGILPRNIKLENRLALSKYYFTAFSLQEIIDNFCKDKKYNYVFACIDIANGHMQKLIDIIKKFKEYNPYSFLIVGNIANPLTYLELSNAGADAVRCGIGSGNACTTSANTGVHYPMASLIIECKKIKNTKNLGTLIIADGGMNNFDDIIKSLALGADNVMCGKIFSEFIESAGKIVSYEFKELDKLYIDTTINNVNNINLVKSWFLNGYIYNIEKSYYGMSTKQAQQEMNCQQLKTAEGISKNIKVTTTIDKWVDNFRHYLSTAMSYCNAINLQSFIGKPEIINISNNAFQAYYK